MRHQCALEVAEMSTHDTETTTDALSGGLLRGGCEHSIRLEATEAVAGRLDEVGQLPSAGDREGTIALDERFWERRNRDINNALPLYPWQLNRDVGSIAALIVTLDRARMAEFQRCQSNHFASSIPRYNSIKTILKRERALLKRLTDEAAR